MDKKLAWVAGGFLGAQALPWALASNGTTSLVPMWPLFGIRFEDLAFDKIAWIFDPSIVMVEPLLFAWRAGAALMIAATIFLIPLALEGGSNIHRWPLVLRRVTAVVWIVGILTFLAAVHILAYLVGLVWFYSAVAVSVLLGGSFLAVRAMWFVSPVKPLAKIPPVRSYNFMLDPADAGAK